MAVVALAELLGENEDFDGLVTSYRRRGIAKAQRTPD